MTMFDRNNPPSGGALDRMNAAQDRLTAMWKNCPARDGCTAPGECARMDRCWAKGTLKKGGPRAAQP